MIKAKGVLFEGIIFKNYEAINTWKDLLKYLHLYYEREEFKYIVSSVISFANSVQKQITIGYDLLYSAEKSLESINYKNGGLKQDIMLRTLIGKWMYSDVLEELLKK